MCEGQWSDLSTTPDSFVTQKEVRNLTHFILVSIFNGWCNLINPNDLLLQKNQVLSNLDRSIFTSPILIHE